MMELECLDQLEAHWDSLLDFHYSILSAWYWNMFWRNSVVNNFFFQNSKMDWLFKEAFHFFWVLHFELLAIFFKQDLRCFDDLHICIVFDFWNKSIIFHNLGVTYSMNNWFQTPQENIFWSTLIANKDLYLILIVARNVLIWDYFKNIW